MVTISISQKEIEKQIQEQVERIEKAVIQAMAFLGEKAITEARTNYGYTPRTDNLLSSIGYHVIKNGEFVVGSPFKANEGGQKGKEFIESLYSQNPKGIVLIVVAGTSSAIFVESRGFNALTSSEMLAHIEFIKMMKDLGFDASKI